MELFRKTPNFDLLGKQLWFFLLSGLLILGTVYLWVSQGEAKFGVDFRGGYEFVVQLPPEATSEGIREAVEKGGFLDPVVQSFEAASHQYSIRMRGTEEGDKVRSNLLTALKTKYPTGTDIVRTDFVGPTIGKELRRRAIIAVALGLIGILLYLTVRFEAAFAIGAVMAVFHDVVVSLGVYLACGFTINMATLAAALTIVGYSVNDTVVIFDRIREELGKSRGEPLSALVNRCVNITLSRTLITQFLTFLSIAALLILGGGAIRDLSVYLFAGMITGCYSTIYIASPIMIWWHKFRGGTEQVT